MCIGHHIANEGDACKPQYALSTAVLMATHSAAGC